MATNPMSGQQFDDLLEIVYTHIDNHIEMRLPKLVGELVKTQIDGTLDLKLTAHEGKIGKLIDQVRAEIASDVNDKLDSFNSEFETRLNCWADAKIGGWIRKMGWVLAVFLLTVGCTVGRVYYTDKIEQVEYRTTLANNVGDIKAQLAIFNETGGPAMSKHLAEVKADTKLFHKIAVKLGVE